MTRSNSISKFKLLKSSIFGSSDFVDLSNSTGISASGTSPSSKKGKKKEGMEVDEILSDGNQSKSKSGKGRIRRRLEVLAVGLVPDRE